MLPTVSDGIVRASGEGSMASGHASDGIILSSGFGSFASGYSSGAGVTGPSELSATTKQDTVYYWQKVFGSTFQV